MWSHPGACRHRSLQSASGSVRRGAPRMAGDSHSKSPESETTTVPVCLRASREVVMVEGQGRLLTLAQEGVYKGGGKELSQSEIIDSCSSGPCAPFPPTTNRTLLSRSPTSSADCLPRAVAQRAHTFQPVCAVVRAVFRPELLRFAASAATLYSR